MKARKADLRCDDAVGASHKEALDRATKEGIIKGDSKNMNPKGALTSEQMATVLKRYHNKYIK
ncbi:S-layer homology domain-containing protein [Lysinibacillus xylanilyticus]|uniref:S-layer homology domain-containing protein n=1 Tax=Lysinibacillus xylanilyticus TaxID=582475 RepID=UPI0036D80AF9